MDRAASSRSSDASSILIFNYSLYTLQGTKLSNGASGYGDLDGGSVVVQQYLDSVEDATLFRAQRDDSSKPRLEKTQLQRTVRRCYIRKTFSCSYGLVPVKSVW